MSTCFLNSLLERMTKARAELAKKVTNEMVMCRFLCVTAFSLLYLHTASKASKRKYFLFFFRRSFRIFIYEWMVFMISQDKISHLLDVWSCVVWEHRRKHLKNCIVDTCTAFLQCEQKGAFQMSCQSEWAAALFTLMWLLSTVGEQMFGETFFLDWREVAKFALKWPLKGMCFDVIT